MKRRSGIKLVYKAAPGEKLKLLPNGDVLIVHPDRAPVIQKPDGTREAVSVGVPRTLEIE